MLFLILNKEEISPYYYVNDINNIYINNYHNTPEYHDVYKEIVHTNWIEELSYIIGIVISLISIYYFTTEINKVITSSE